MYSRLTDPFLPASFAIDWYRELSRWLSRSYSCEVVFQDEFFCTLTLKPIEGGFIKPIQFETQPLKRMDEFHSFVFPREEFVTPTSYPNGFITCVSPRTIFHNCKMHEFGYLGSLVFNFRGDLVAITYIDKGQMQVWTVKSAMLHKMNSFVFVVLLSPTVYS